MKQQAILDVELNPQDEPKPPAEPAAMVRASEAPADAFVAMLERLATNPQTNMDVFERLLAARDREKAQTARALFEADFALMQGELPTIDEHGAIKVNGEVRSKYAKLEDIVDAVRPVMQARGFSLRFRNLTDDGKHKTIGILSHRAGHSETDEFITAPDKSGAKNDIQAIGSARSYGQRYCAISLLNIVSREPGFRDDDGQGTSAKEAPTAPAGFDVFLTALQAKAAKGNAELYPFWNAADPKLRQYVTTHRLSDWQRLRAEAGKVKS